MPRIQSELAPYRPPQAEIRPLLVDPQGRPLHPTLNRATVTASSVGLRRPTYGPVAPGATPERVARVLLDSTEGVIEDYLTWLEEIEERDCHYSGQLHTRKSDLCSRPMYIEPVGKDPSDEERELAELCQRQLIDGEGDFSGMLYDLLDGIAKPFAVVEPVWGVIREKGRTYWVPIEYSRIDQRWCEYDDDTLSRLHFIDLTQPDGVPVDYTRFLVHASKSRSGLQCRGGLGRLCSLMVFLKNVTVKDWCAFCEIFGLPMRIGRYTKASSNEQLLEEYRGVLSQLGADAAVLVPDDLAIEFEDGRGAKGQGSGSGGAHDSFVRYCDEQMSKAIRGQTMTMDNGSSRAQGQVHERVAEYITQSDGRSLERTVQLLVKTWYGFNAPPGVLGRFRIHTKPDEDLEAWTKAILPVIQAGLPVSRTQLYEKYGLERPEDDDDQFGGLGGPQNAFVTSPDTKVLQDEQRAEEMAMKTAELKIKADASAAKAKTGSANQRALNAIEDLIADAPHVQDPWAPALLTILESSNSYNDAAARVAALGAQVDADPFVKALATELVRLRVDPDA